MAQSAQTKRCTARTSCHDLLVEHGQSISISTSQTTAHPSGLSKPTRIGHLPCTVNQNHRRPAACRAKVPKLPKAIRTLQGFLSKRIYHSVSSESMTMTLGGVEVCWELRPRTTNLSDWSDQGCRAQHQVLALDIIMNYASLHAQKLEFYAQPFPQNLLLHLSRIPRSYDIYDLNCSQRP